MTNALIRAFRRILGETDDVAEFGVLDNSTYSSEQQPDGTTPVFRNPADDARTARVCRCLSQARNGTPRA